MPERWAGGSKAANRVSGEPLEIRYETRHTLHCVDGERCVQPQLFALFDSDIDLILERIVFSQCYNPALIPFDSGRIIRIDNNDIVIDDRRQRCLYRINGRVVFLLDGLINRCA